MLARLFSAGLLALVVAGCDCGEDRHRSTPTRERDGGRPDAATAEPAEPASSTPAPAAAPPNQRFGVASVTLEVAEGQRSAAVKITLPAGATVRDGDRQVAAIYFDNGPPISAALTVREGAWHTEKVRVPAVVETAERLVMRIPTTPQTSFIWDVTGAWRTAASSPLTLEAGN